MPDVLRTICRALALAVVLSACQQEAEEGGQTRAATTTASAGRGAASMTQGGAASPVEPKAIFLQPGGGRIYGGAEDGSQDQIVFKLGDGESGSTFEFAENEVLPNNGPPEHIHFETDEAFYVANGTFRVKVGDHVEDVGPGSFVYAPRGLPHVFVNTGTTKGTLLIVTSPANFEAYMREAVPALQRTPPDQKALDALAEKYKVRIVGPPLGSGPVSDVPRNP